YDAPTLIICRLVELAHALLLPLALVATRARHRLPPEQLDSAPPPPDPTPLGPRFGTQCAFRAMRNAIEHPYVRPWLARVVDGCVQSADVCDALVLQLATHGAWDLDDVLAVEWAARRTLVEWVAPLLRVDARFNVVLGFGTCWLNGNSE